MLFCWKKLVICNRGYFFIYFAVFANSTNFLQQIICHVSGAGIQSLYQKQCDQIGRFIGLWGAFQSLWQQLICPTLLHSQAIFVKVLKSIIFLVKSFLGNFCRLLAIFFWSHWSRVFFNNTYNRTLSFWSTLCYVLSFTICILALMKSIDDYLILWHQLHLLSGQCYKTLFEHLHKYCWILSYV